MDKMLSVNEDSEEKITSVIEEPKSKCKDSIHLDEDGKEWQIVNIDGGEPYDLVSHLNNNIERLKIELAEEREINSELTACKQALSDEIVDLSRSLFEEANEMVSRERRARSIIEANLDACRKELESVKEKLLIEQMQLSELRGRIQVADTDHIMSRDSGHPNKVGSGESGYLQWIPTIANLNRDEILAPFQDGFDSRSRIDDLAWEGVSQALESSDFLSFSTFAQAVDGLDSKKLLSHEYVREVHEKDVVPLLERFVLRSRAFLARLVRCLLRGTVSIEPINETLIPKAGFKNDGKDQLKARNSSSSDDSHKSEISFLNESLDVDSVCSITLKYGPKKHKDLGTGNDKYNQVMCDDSKGNKDIQNHQKSIKALLNPEPCKESDLKEDDYGNSLIRNSQSKDAVLEDEEYKKTGFSNKKIKEKIENDQSGKKYSKDSKVEEIVSQGNGLKGSDPVPMDNIYQPVEDVTFPLPQIPVSPALANLELTPQVKSVHTYSTIPYQMLSDENLEEADGVAGGVERKSLNSIGDFFKKTFASFNNSNAASPIFLEGIGSEDIPTNSNIIRTCKLCGKYANEGGFRVKLSDELDDEWLPIDGACRMRLVALAHYYVFLRHLSSGIFSNRPIIDLYCDLLIRRRLLFYLRIDVGSIDFFRYADLEAFKVTNIMP